MLSEMQRVCFKTLLFLILLTIINFTIPFFGFLLNIFLPIPIVYLAVKYSLKQAMIVIVLAALINGLILGAAVAMYTIIGFGLIAFIMGGAIKEGLKAKTVLIITIITVLISNLIMFIVLIYLQGFDYMQLFDNILEIMAQTGDIAEVEIILRQQLELIETIFPALLLISSIISAALIYYATYWFLERAGLKVNSYKAIKDWYFNRYIVSLGIILSLLFKNNIYMLNLSLVLFFLVFLQGFAVGLAYLDKKQSPFLFSIYLLLIIFLNFISFIILIGVGLIDMWFNLRREKKSNTG